MSALTRPPLPPGDQAAALRPMREADVDAVMAAIVGAAGLAPCLSAARAGKRLLLANKEALVVGGALFIEAVREGGAERAVIVAGRLVDDDAALLSEPASEGGQRLWLVAHPACAVHGVENVEHGFGNVDSDENRGYDHVACPCDARSGW